MNIMKKTIKLTESQLRNAIKSILKEYEYQDGPIDNEEGLSYGIVNGQEVYSEEDRDFLKCICDSIIALKNVSEKLIEISNLKDYKEASYITIVSDRIREAIKMLEEEYGECE